MKVFYFSATGNSLAVAKAVSSKFDGEIISIPQVIDGEEQTYKDDVIGVVFPTYGCTVPEYVQRFLKKAKLDAGYIFAVGTYGMGAGKTMEIAQQIAKDSGYRFDYVKQILMLDNCQPQFDIAKEKIKLPSKKVDEQIAHLIADIQVKKKITAKSSFGDKFATWLCDTAFNIERPDYAQKKYSVDENCSRCGTCAKVCPVSNIKVTDHVAFSDHCVCCQACIHACPKQAIHCKRERNTVRWRNQDVTLAELIKANNQMP